MTNEVKGLYHDDCSEKRKKNIFCILNWGMAVSCSRNMNFAFFAHFCIRAFFADQVELIKHIPPIFLFFM